MALFALVVSLVLLCSTGVSLGLPANSQTKSISLKRISRPSHGSPKFGSVSIINDDITYAVTTKVGTQMFDLIVDTGSSNTWVGAGKNYIPGPTAHNTGRNVSFVYGSGNFSGIEFNDDVSVGDFIVRQQSIGNATSSFGFDGFDGILGLGPDDLTNGTVSGLGLIPTFTQNLKSQGVISKNVLGVYFHPELGNDTADVNGLLTFGGVDTDKCPGTITYTPRTQVLPFAMWWGVDVQATSYGSTVLSGEYSTLVDTGTTVIVLPVEILQNFLQASGGALDPDIGIVSFEKRPTENFVFKISGVELALTPDEYLIPSLQVPVFGLPTDQFWSWFSTFGPPPTFMNVTAVIGMKFLESYCSIYDTDNNRVGFTKRA